MSLPDVANAGAGRHDASETAVGANRRRCPEVLPRITNIRRVGRCLLRSNIPLSLCLGFIFI